MATPVKVNCVAWISFFSLLPHQLWRRNYRAANLRQRLITEPHSPSEQRAWVVRNLDKWYDAFQPKADGQLYLKPEDRVRIW
jgi:putative endopeptidase